MLLRPAELPLQRGDRLLFAGTDESPELRFGTTLVNGNVLDFVVLGRDPGGWVWEHLVRRAL